MLNPKSSVKDGIYQFAQDGGRQWEIVELEMLDKEAPAIEGGSEGGEGGEE